METAITYESGVALDLHQAVQEAGLILAYIAQKGLDINKKKIEILVRAKEAFERNEQGLDISQESDFWCAYQEISHAIYPVTIVSIKARSDVYGRQVWTLHGKQQLSLARLAVRRYQSFSVFSLLILLIVQIYAGTGARILNDFESVEQEISQSKDKIRKLNDDLAKLETDDERQLVKQQQSQLERLLESKEKDLEARYRLLEVWNLFRSFSAPEIQSGIDHNKWVTDDLEEQAPRPIEEDSTELLDGALDQTSISVDNEEIERLFEQSEVQSQVVLNREDLEQIGNIPQDKKFIGHVVLAGKILLEALNIYFLPLVYGLLGACAYVLRTISTEIHEYIYSPESDIRLQLRLYLGTLSGFAVAWFINQATAPGLAESITPLTLAFLAGYSVEVLFAAMDKIVAAFSSSNVKPRDV